LDVLVDQGYLSVEPARNATEISEEKNVRKPRHHILEKNEEWASLDRTGMHFIPTGDYVSIHINPTTGDEI
jgi:hypothetical protein